MNTAEDILQAALDLASPHALQSLSAAASRSRPTYTLPPRPSSQHTTDMAANTLALRSALRRGSAGKEPCSSSGGCAHLRSSAPPRVAPARRRKAAITVAAASAGSGSSQGRRSSTSARAAANAWEMPGSISGDGQKESAEKVGVLLLNLGGPETLDDVQPFLYNLFADPDIIRLPEQIGFLQAPLAWLISNLRASKSREGYETIGGGSPLRRTHRRAGHGPPERPAGKGASTARSTSR